MNGINLTLKLGIAFFNSLIFKTSILSKKKENSLFSVHEPLGAKLLTRLRLKFSHINEHKFRHGSNDTINPMCACGTDIETTEHFLLLPFPLPLPHFYSTVRLELFENFEKIDPNFLNLNQKDQVNLLLYGYQINELKSFNQSTLKNVTSYVKATGRFDKPLISFKQ